jgi:hypothetical protein
LTAARRSSDQWEQQLRHEPHRPGGVRHEVLCRRVESVARRIENAVTPWSRRRLGSSSHGVRSARTPPTPASHRIEKQGAPGSGDYETARSSVNAAVPLRAPAHRSSEPRVPGIRSLSLAPRSHRILVRAQVRWGPPVRALERPDLRPPSHRWPSLVSVAWRIRSCGGCERTSRSGRCATATDKAALDVLRHLLGGRAVAAQGKLLTCSPNRGMFCGRPKARKVGGPVALSSRRLTAGCGSVACGPLASRT